ncbi:MAG: hypothetical protein ACI8XO_004479, partial [Verrucomicrobiales bacterium]
RVARIAWRNFIGCEGDSSLWRGILKGKERLGCKGVWGVNVGVKVKVGIGDSLLGAVGSRMVGGTPAR